MLKVGKSTKLTLLSRRALLVAVALIFGGAALIPSSVSAMDYAERLSTNGWLRGGESLWSPNRLYRLTQQYDGNLVLYAMPGNKPLWSSGTAGARYAATQMQSDGNLVVRAEGNVPVWSSGSRGSYPVLFMQDDANVVIRAQGNVPIWATGSQSMMGCTDGSRTQAAEYAASNQFYEPVPAVYWQEPSPVGQTNSVFGIHLRYNPVKRCAWGLIEGGFFSEVWIDRSTDGGRTWTGWLGARRIQSPNTTTYTGVFNDSVPYVVRACGYGINVIRCTAWF